jgi:hypothetical protein
MDNFYNFQDLCILLKKRSVEVNGEKPCVIHFDILQWHAGVSFKERKRPIKTKIHTGI